MSTPTTPLLPYGEARKRQLESAFRQAEIPLEHSVSLPLPTLRFGESAYVSFAAPAIRLAGQPMRQAAPDRWWAVSAHNGRLLIYTRDSVTPLAPDTTWETVTLPRPDVSIEELMAAMSSFEQVMDDIAAPFFAQEPADPSLREAVKRTLSILIPSPLEPQYRALASDFFTWLET